MPTCVPNHHAGHPGFAGATGLLAALTMAWGRDGQARLAASLTHLGADDDLVDVGCGPGAAVRHAARIARAAVGVDPAPVMLRVARALSRRSRARYLDGAAERLPLADGSASVLWALATVHHWPDIDGALDEAARVLRPGGRLLAVERLVAAGARGLRSHGWTPEQADAFAAACAAHDLDDVVVSVEEVGRGRVLAVRARRP